MSAPVEIGEFDDAPLTLSDACRLLFGGKITPSTLRAEAARGRLTIVRIGRTDFVTRAAIREMWRQCVQAPRVKAHGSGSGPRDRGPAAQPSVPSGSSEMTAESRVARDAALMIAAKLKKSSKPTSRKNTGPRPVNVIPLRG